MILFFRLFELISVSEKQFSGQLWENINRETKKKIFKQINCSIITRSLINEENYNPISILVNGGGIFNK